VTEGVSFTAFEVAAPLYTILPFFESQSSIDVSRAADRLFIPRYQGHSDRFDRDGRQKNSLPVRRLFSSGGAISNLRNASHSGYFLYNPIFLAIPRAVSYSSAASFFCSAGDLRFTVGTDSVIMTLRMPKPDPFLDYLRKPTLFAIARAVSYSS